MNLHSKRQTMNEITRREALKGGSAAAVAVGAAILSDTLIQEASAQTSEPRITLGDNWIIDDNPDGNESLILEHTVTGNRYTLHSDGTLESQSINSSEAYVSGETFIKAMRSSNSSTQTAGTMINLVDSEMKDVRNEFTSSQEFIPNKTGYYFIRAKAELGGSTVPGDRVTVRIQNTNSGSTVDLLQNTAGSGNPFTGFVFFPRLTAGTTYEIQVTNSDSSFEVHDTSNVQILWSIIQ